MKRFYKHVTVEEPEAGSFAVLLDGRPVRTPARHKLRLPGAALARAVAAEWEGQGEAIRLDLMPFTRMAATAIDRIAPDAKAYAGLVAAYAETDLLCYRADAPAALVERQAATWQPLVDWAAETLDATLTVTTGVAPVTQPEATLAALLAAVEAHDCFEMAALGVAAMASGSLVIALSLSHGRLDADAAFDASQIDESWQTEQWGVDPEAQSRRQRLHDDLVTAESFLALLRTD